MCDDNPVSFFKYRLVFSVGICDSRNSLLNLWLIWTGFELVVAWADRTVEGTLEMAELENASPHEAEKWILHPILSPYL